MIVRSLNDAEATDHFVDWGNGTSHRLLTAKDGMGFSVCHTVVRANTVSFLQYRNHLEASTASPERARCEHEHASRWGFGAV
ncbi:MULTISPECIES: ectoine synthase [Paraburkholderia]|uniref:Ectoine synthase n=1 Tax=Paraburkholderia guartelaensis TaxID=2546446 RepID=A0ABU9SMU8_9BURK|nr:ectoine synthase [Paraburkholderia nodosa]